MAFSGHEIEKLITHITTPTLMSSSIHYNHYLFFFSPAYVLFSRFVFVVIVLGFRPCRFDWVLLFAFIPFVVVVFMFSVLCFFFFIIFEIYVYIYRERGSKRVKTRERRGSVSPLFDFYFAWRFGSDLFCTSV